MQLCQEEIFGPVVSIQKFSEEKVFFSMKPLIVQADSNSGGSGHCQRLQDRASQLFLQWRRGSMLEGELKLALLWMLTAWLN